MYVAYSEIHDCFVNNSNGACIFETDTEIRDAIKDFIEQEHYGEDLIDYAEDFVIYELQEIKNVTASFTLNFNVE